MATAMTHKARSRKSHHRAEAMKAHTFTEMSKFNLALHAMRVESSTGAMISGILQAKKKEGENEGRD